MEKVVILLEEVLNIDLIQVVLSSAKKESKLKKVTIRPVILKDELYFQATQMIDNKAIHHNYLKDEIKELLESWIMNDFKQTQIYTKCQEATILVSKKGKMTIKTKKVQKQVVQNLEHNRKKQYIIEEGQKVPFMVDLKIMTEEGKIVTKRYDKFKQINRYLEFIEDILPKLPKDRTVHIIDFGCGKSYLTFAMYYYLKILKGYDIKITGLDLKADVIDHCNHLSQVYGYEGLTFLQGDIADYEHQGDIDMVVSLHACDTATDYAIAKAVSWNATVILAVPCCQHELNEQINAQELEGILSYGIIKERVAALVTDGLRGELLEAVGYKTNLLEFIDMSHTPKNILIRAIKSREVKALELKDSYQKTKGLLHVSPLLESLLEKQYRRTK